MVNSDCRAVITDFGSARHLTATDLNQEAKQAENGQKAALSLEATLCGSTNTVSITLTGDVYTLRWAAPELLREEEATLASDIWALGWVAYEVMLRSHLIHDPFSKYAPETGHDQLNSISKRCQGRRRYHTRHSGKPPVHHQRRPIVIDPVTLLPHACLLENRSSRATDC